jgi:hypothetical protein
LSPIACWAKDPDIKKMLVRNNNIFFIFILSANERLSFNKIFRFYRGKLADKQRSYLSEHLIYPEYSENTNINPYEGDQYPLLLLRGIAYQPYFDSFGF